MSTTTIVLVLVVGLAGVVASAFNYYWGWRAGLNKGYKIGLDSGARLRDLQGEGHPILRDAPPPEEPIRPWTDGWCPACGHMLRVEMTFCGPSIEHRLCQREPAHVHAYCVKDDGILNGCGFRWLMKPDPRYANLGRGR